MLNLKNRRDDPPARLPLRLVPLLFTAACASVPNEDAQDKTKQGRPPNVLLIITDDQGYGDVAAHGNEMIKTPSLDALWSESVRLTDFHVDPTCSPTRSALMSGRDSTRTGVWHTIMGRSIMASDETTLAETFQAGGYRTGMFGKWHLGDNYPCRPQDQGFEHVAWHHGGGVGQGPDYWGNDYFDDTYDVNGIWRPFKGYCTDVWFDEAADFIAKDDERPFFAYLSTNAPHGPFHVADSYADPYRDQGVPETMAKFYGMITCIDENVGQLRTKLTELGLAENTILIFMSDNGTARGSAPGRGEEGTWPGFNAGMRGAKGSAYDGGHRVPFYVHWPEGGIVGGRDVDTLAAHIDVLPTLAEICLSDDAEDDVDGRSLAKELRGAESSAADRTLFVHSQRIEHPKKWRQSAVLTERWRLINGVELYDIEADPSQATDVATSHPEAVATLRSEYETWWDSLAPAMGETVHIGVGGKENPAHLMSHDWHTNNGPVPWHQNSVRNGALSNGHWAIDVLTQGDHLITLRRWPSQLDRPMDCVHAEVTVAGQRLAAKLEPGASYASFQFSLPEGTTELATTLTRSAGETHGAYFVEVQHMGMATSH